MSISSTLWSVRTSATFRRLLLACLAAFLLVGFSASLARAQQVSGITGTVTDQSGAVVPGANVTVTNDATMVASRAVTSPVGAYTITDLIPGTYTVRVEKQGFEAAVITNVVVEAGGKKSSADAVLKTGATTQTIEVTSSSIALETTQPDIGTTIENIQVEELPMEIGNVGGGVGPRGRQIDQFIFLAPGVQGGEFEHRIDGGVSYQNEVVFNGVVAVQSETQGFQSNINPPFEMVNEFRVLTSNFSAQYGLAQGVAAYNFATGSNALHADVFEIMRNSYFDAPGASNDQFNNDQPSVDRENNYGFSVGGPVWLPHVYNGKNKTFFHVSSEWYKFNQSVNSTITDPTPAMIGGDFSSYTYNNSCPVGGFLPDTTTPCVVPIYVPNAWATNPALEPAGCTPGAAPGQQFPGNKIPTDCFSTVSKSLLGFIPPPTPSALSGTGVANNYFATLVTPTTQTSWGFTLDHNLTEKQSVHGSFWRDSYTTTAFDHAGYYDNVLSAAKSEPRLGTGIFLTYSNALSNNLVMTAGVGWMGEINNELNDHLGYSFGPVAGSGILPTINFNGSAPNNPETWGVNSNGETNSTNRKLGISFDNNWLWTKGRHTMNIGWEIRRAYQDDTECQQCGGGLSFNSATTSNGTNFSGSGSSFASFLLGDVDSAYRQFAAENRLRNFYIAPYIQDAFKFSPRLTIDIGLRWDIPRPFRNNTDDVVFFSPGVANPGAISPVTGLPLLGGATQLGFCTYCSGYDRASIHWKELSPRAGFAYELNHKTVILGGFALNFLDTGAYEFGNNKLAVNYGNLLTGVYNVPSIGTDVPQFGEWDTNTVPVPQSKSIYPSNFNGTGSLRQFSSDPGPQAYIQMWNLGIQRELPWNMFLQASYVGNHGIHEPSMLDPINQQLPANLTQFCPTGIPTDPSCLMSSAAPNYAWTSAASQTALQGLGFRQASVTCPNGASGTYFTPYVNFLCNWGAGAGLPQALLPYAMYSPSESAGGLSNILETDGSSTYNALQLQTQKRFSNGLSFLVAYTLSRSMSNTDSGFSQFNFGAENAYNPRSEWSVGANDQTHLLTVTEVYELPIGPGGRYLHGSDSLWAKNLIGGWQVSGIYTYASGTPGVVYVGGDDGDPFGNGFNRANIVAGQPLSLNYNNYYQELAMGQAGPPIFNTAKFADPGYRQGNEPRELSSFRGPFQMNENMALAKKLYFGEKVSGEIKMDFYNVFNRFRICTPNTTVVGSYEGQTPNAGFGYITTSVGSPCQGNTPRQGQAYFRISF